jgi:uncharacterized protein YndB with AHSA1/START domain
MADIRHLIEIDGTPDQIYPAVASRAGVAGWWTPHVTVERGSLEGDSEGDSLRMHFDRISSKQDIEVVELVQGRRVRWACGKGSFDGTEISFELEPRGERTALRFAHAGWKSPTAHFAQCNFNWGFFMQSLQRLVETGEGMPR